MVMEIWSITWLFVFYSSSNTNFHKLSINLSEINNQYNETGQTNDSNAWRTTVKEKGMPWVNVLRKSPEVTKQYGVRGVPSNFLIDCSTGKIVAAQLRGDALLEKLAEIFE